MAEERLCDRLQVKNYPSYIAFEANQLYRYKNASHTDYLYNFALAEDYKLHPAEEVPRTLASPRQVLAAKILHYYCSLFWMSLGFFPLGACVFTALLLFFALGSLYSAFDAARFLLRLLCLRRSGSSSPAQKAAPQAPPAPKLQEPAQAPKQKRK